MEIEKQKNYWDNREFKSDMSIPSVRFRQVVFNNFKVKGKTLDIGCANNIVCKDYGIDISVPKDHSGRVVQMDFNNIQYKDESFDNVVSWCSLNHSYTFDKALSEMVRVCRVGGMIIFECPYRYCYPTLTHYIGSWIHGYDRLTKFGHNGTFKSIINKFKELGCELHYKTFSGAQGTQIIMVFEKL